MIHWHRTGKENYGDVERRMDILLAFKWIDEGHILREDSWKEFPYKDHWLDYLENGI